jgi:hypothetical protein
MCLPLRKVVSCCCAILFLLMCVKPAMGQTTLVKGVIRDARTNEPVAYATVFFDESSVGTTSDEAGNYRLETDQPYTKLKIMAVGYVPVSKELIAGTEQVFDFKLKVDAKQLNEVVVKGQKTKYRNKDNPAVELIRKVIDHKSENRPEAFNYFEYEKYEKVQFALSNVTDKFQNRKAFKKFQFVFENLDTNKLEGKAVLPVYLKESISEVRYRKSPEAKKEIIKANKTVAFEGYVDNQGMDAYMKYLYQDINIYDNNITMLTNQFISPIANLSPTFYKFFINDTITENNQKFIRLGFVPRNHSDFLFQGIMHITLDSSYAVAKIDMSVNKDINLNWVKELKINQTFEKKEGQGYVLVKDEFSADFGLSRGKMGIYGQKIASYKDLIVGKQRPDQDYKGDAVETNDSANFREDEYWLHNRHNELSTSEKGVYTTIDSIKKVPAFKRTLEVMVILLAGYKSITPYFELGPISTFYSFNPIEGFRLRAGGRTTNAFSKRVVLEGYGAYGFKDERWKYYGGVTYSLTKRSIYEFPVRSLKASYQRETKIPGQELQFIQEDNFFLSFKRGNNDKWLYNDIINLEYLHEFKDHFSFSIGYKNWTQHAAGGLHYNTVNYNDGVNDVKQLQTSEMSLVLRWAPNESFYQGKTYRIPISYKNPVFTLRFINGTEGFLGGEYDYQNISLNATKRFYLSQLGYTDVALEGGKIIGKVPFPLLSIHRANQTYAYQLQSYNLMNFLEFVSDQYASVQLDHCFNGFFFNKIPLLRRLKWREAMSLKVLYGSVSSQNNPAKSGDLYQFPLTPEGVPITYSLESKPYIEGSVAIANIFKFFRIDLVKRFTYLDHPDISQLGIRARFKFDF